MSLVDLRTLLGAMLICMAPSCSQVEGQKQAPLGSPDPVSQIPKSCTFELDGSSLRVDISEKKGSTLVEVVLSVTRFKPSVPMNMRNVQYHFRVDIAPEDGTPYELWEGERHMYSLVLDGVSSWRELLQSDKLCDRLLPLRVLGAAEELP